jgi:hypothetical protein
MFATPAMKFRTMELAVESEPVSDVTGCNSCPDSVLDSSNPISADVPRATHKLPKIKTGYRGWCKWG